MNDEMIIYKFEDAVDFIAERCDIDKDLIEKVLELEEGYLRSIGVIEEDKELISDEEFIIDGYQRTSEPWKA